MLTLAIIFIVSCALLAGAIWGIYGSLPKPLEGFIVAMAGGALIISAVLELIEPATRNAPASSVFAFVFAGAVVFVIADYLVDKQWGPESGGGLLVAITLDGVPENLALGVALIGAEPVQVAALAGSIFLSNLPEAAAGAREMAKQGKSKIRVLSLWGFTALLLFLAAVAGNYFLDEASETVLACIRAFAGGAVVASLAVAVFPKAFTESSYLTGIATVIGLILALYLNQLS